MLFPFQPLVQDADGGLLLPLHLLCENRRKEELTEPENIGERYAVYDYYCNQLEVSSSLRVPIRPLFSDPIITFLSLSRHHKQICIHIRTRIHINLSSQTNVHTYTHTPTYKLIITNKCTHIYTHAYI